MSHGGITPMAAGQHTAADAVIAAAGLKNAMQGFDRYRPLSQEGVIASAPDLLLVTTDGVRTLGGEQQLWTLPGLALTPAGKQRRVLIVDDMALLGFGLETPAALAAAPRGGAKVMRCRTSPQLAIIGLLVLLTLLALVAANLGALTLSFRTLWREPFSDAAWHIWLNIRLPRVLLAVVIGCALAVSGAVMQGLFRNPLADPSLLGISSGGALFVALFIVMPLALPVTIALYGHMLAAFLGSLLVSLLIYGISRSGHGNLSRLLLAGIAINALCMAAIGVLSYVSSDQQLRQFSLWMMGSLSQSQWPTGGFRLADPACGAADAAAGAPAEPVAVGGRRGPLPRGERPARQAAAAVVERLADRRGGSDERRDRLCRPGGAASGAHAPRRRSPLAAALLRAGRRLPAAGQRYAGAHAGGAGRNAGGADDQPDRRSLFLVAGDAPAGASRWITPPA